jgi:hypothetical protein
MSLPIPPTGMVSSFSSQTFALLQFRNGCREKEKEFEKKDKKAVFTLSLSLPPPFFLLPRSAVRLGLSGTMNGLLSLTMILATIGDLDLLIKRFKTCRGRFFETAGSKLACLSVFRHFRPSLVFVFKAL